MAKGKASAARRMAKKKKEDESKALHFSRSLNLRQDKKTNLLATLLTSRAVEAAFNIIDLTRRRTITRDELTIFVSQSPYFRGKNAVEEADKFIDGMNPENPGNVTIGEFKAYLRSGKVDKEFVLAMFNALRASGYHEEVKRSMERHTSQIERRQSTLTNLPNGSGNRDSDVAGILNTSAAEGTDDDVDAGLEELKASETRLALHEPRNALERAQFWTRWNIASKSWFENFILFLIGANCIFLAFDNPLNGPEHWSNKAAAVIDPIFLTFFVIEMVVKMFAFGFIRRTLTEEELPNMPVDYYKADTGYFMDGWNYLDFVVVVFGLLGAVPSVPNVSAIRAIRVLRPLRAVKRIPELRILVTVLLKSVVAVARVALILSLFFAFFGIAGVALFQGVLRQRCYDDATGLQLDTDDADRVCSTTSAGLFQCPSGFTCKAQAANLYYGVVSFDTFPDALLQIFQTITMATWSNLLYPLMDGVSPIGAFIYFFLIILLISFFALNLMLAAIEDTFNEEKDKAESEAAEEQAKEAEAATRGDADGKDAGEDGSDGNDGGPRKELYPEFEVFKGQLFQAAARSVVDWLQHRKLEATRSYRTWLESKKLVVPPECFFPLPGKTVRAMCERAEDELFSVPKLSTVRSTHGGGKYLINEFKDGAGLSDSEEVKGRGQNETVEGVASETDLSLEDDQPDLWLDDLVRSSVKRENNNIGALVLKMTNGETQQPDVETLRYTDGAKGGGERKLLSTASAADASRDAKRDTRDVSGSEGRGGLSETVGDASDVKVRLLRSLSQDNDKEEKKKAAQLKLDYIRIYIDRLVENNAKIDEDFKEFMKGLVRNCNVQMSLFWRTHHVRTWIEGKPALLQLNFALVQSSWFRYFILLVIMLNTGTLAYDYYGITEAEEKGCAVVNTVCSYIFLVEMILKLAGYGFRGYIADNWNNFDAIVVIMSFIPSADSISGLRTLRLLRIFKLFNNVPFLRKLLVIVIDCISQVGYLVILVFVFLFMFSVLGVQLFAGMLSRMEEVPRWNFDDLWSSMLIVFMCVSGDSWPDVMWDTTSETSRGTPLYFVMLVVLGDFMIMNLFIAILLVQFENDEKVLWSISADAALSLMIEGQSSPAELLEAQREALEESRKIEELSIQINRASYDFYIEDKRERKAISRTPWRTSRRDAHEKINATSNSFRERSQARSTGIEMTELKRMSSRTLESPLGFPDEERAEKDRWSKFMGTSFGMDCEHPVRIELIRICEKKWFKNLIFFLIGVNCVILAVENPHDENPHTAFFVFDLLLTIIFFFEMVFKIIAYGMGPRNWNKPSPPFDATDAQILEYAIDYSYLGDVFNRIDGFVVLVSLLSFIPGAEFLKIFRALRPFRLLIRARNTKVIVKAVMSAVPNAMNIVVFLFVFFTVFGILCVGAFKGQFYSCSESDVANKSECLQAGGEWTNMHNNYDNMWEAFLTLFQVSTLSGWNVIMYASIDANGVDQQPKKNNQPAWGLMYFVFIFLCAFFAMNLFIAVLIDQFNKMHEQLSGSAFMTDAQRQWVHFFKIAKSTTLYKYTAPPKSKIRANSLALVGQPPKPAAGFEIFILACIFLNALVIATQHYDQPEAVTTFNFVGNLIFNIVFLFEAVVKIVAWTWPIYIKDGWNKFDFFIVVISFASYGVDGVAGLSALRLFRLFRLFRMVAKVPALRDMYETLIMSLGSLINIGALVVIVFYTWAVLGVYLFGKVAWCDAGLTQHANFVNFPAAMATLWRLATGDAWEEIQWGLQTSEADGCCSKSEGNCGYEWAPLYTWAFMIFVGLVMVNLFIAVILEGFSETSDEKAFVDHLDEWRDNWNKLDPQATGILPAADVIELVKFTGKPIGLALKPGTTDEYVASKVCRFLRLTLPLLVFKSRVRRLPVTEGIRTSPVELMDKDDTRGEWVWCCCYQDTLESIASVMFSEFTEEDAKKISGKQTNLVQEEFSRLKSQLMQRWYAVSIISEAWVKYKRAKEEAKTGGQIDGKSSRPPPREGDSSQGGAGPARDRTSGAGPARDRTSGVSRGGARNGDMEESGGASDIRDRATFPSDRKGAAVESKSSSAVVEPVATARAVSTDAQGQAAGSKGAEKNPITLHSDGSGALGAKDSAPHRVGPLSQRKRDPGMSSGEQSGLDEKQNSSLTSPESSRIASPRSRRRRRKKRKKKSAKSAFSVHAVPRVTLREGLSPKATQAAVNEPGEQGRAMSGFSVHSTRVGSLRESRGKGSQRE